MTIYINPKYQHLEPFLKELSDNFEKIGETIYKGRNIINVVDYKGLKLNIKSFKVPHIINKIAYAWIRGSKARHSYEYAVKMRDRGSNTPEPVAYIELTKKGLFDRSFYVSIHYKYDFTIRDLIGFEFPDKTNILQQFAKFTFKKMHKRGIHHLDYSRGNILITKKKNKKYKFSVVDINRMRFEKMPYLKGLKNFSQIWASEDELAIVAREYARLNHKDPEEAAQLLINWDRKHKSKINRKAALKKKILRRKE
ncbi:lipopolysaccharide kinase InaA family protein [Plebeiibacterium marinum]|uniref:Lipopolysaccharide kinase InaA family protein n=1 Tax=Plebeiibacterium marinum TaxID=2992111 RepID=A0AAE3MF68_9BACT|nr:lipopolysaccharide kinase InaA family protein [Plebeiobacterium marinum]MCW3806399.1 lipopolysaccharide kinase InaA family protein [Plebeiobacterium marinum]